MSVATLLLCGTAIGSFLTQTRARYKLSGFDSIAAYRQTLAFEVFAFWYHGLAPGRESRYYVGIQF